MIKFLYTTDSHGRGSNPAARLDNFPETILRKFRWINKKAEELEVDGILHGGDWVETPDVANTFVSALAEVLHESKVKWYGILGNHDIYGQNPETFKKTPLAIASSAGAFTRLSEIPIIFSNSNETVAITGKDSYFDLDRQMGRTDYVSSEKVPNAVNIRVVHGMLDDHKWLDNVDCTVIDDIVDMNADIMLTGHIHPGYGIIKRNGKIFCNPNALGRVSASIGDVNMEVRVALIIIDGPIYDVELIPLPIDVARPSGEVIDRDKLVAEKEHKKQLDVFVSSLKTNDVTVETGIFNPYKILDVVAKEDSLDDNIVTMIRGKLGQAEEELKKGE